MLISKVIERLKEKQKEYGDIECVVEDTYLLQGYNDIESIETEWETDISIEEAFGQIRIYY